MTLRDTFGTCLTNSRLQMKDYLGNHLTVQKDLIENFRLLYFSEITLCLQMWKTVMNGNTVLQRYVAEQLHKEAQHNLTEPPGNVFTHGNAVTKISQSPCHHCRGR